MWNILIVIIIAIIIWMFNPLGHFSLKQPTQDVDPKTKNEVNQVENSVIQQVNQSKQLQEQQMKDLENQ